VWHRTGRVYRGKREESLGVIERSRCFVFARRSTVPSLACPRKKKKGKEQLIGDRNSNTDRLLPLSVPTLNSFPSILHRKLIVSMPFSFCFVPIHASMSCIACTSLCLISYSPFFNPFLTTLFPLFEHRLYIEARANQFLFIPSIHIRRSFGLAHDFRIPCLTPSFWYCAIPSGRLAATWLSILNLVLCILNMCLLTTLLPHVFFRLQSSDAFHRTRFTTHNTTSVAPRAGLQCLFLH
jgi:hypothetical protein